MTIQRVPGRFRPLRFLFGDFGGQGQDLQGGLKRDDGFKGRNSVIAVGRDEVRDLFPRHALPLGSDGLIAQSWSQHLE